MAPHEQGKWITNTLAQLVATPTFSGREDNLIPVIERLIPSDATILRQKVEENRHNLVIVPPGVEPANARIALFAHSDTVPPASPEMLEPRTKEGLLYGLGACDMKGSIAAYLFLLNQGKLTGEVIVLTVDEETEMKGAKAFSREKENLLPSLEYGILGEPTGMRLVDGHQGVAHTRIAIRGKGGHASRPELADNPIEKAARFMLDFIRVYSPREGILGREKFSFTKIEAGNSLNVIPEECHIYTDIRTNENTSLEEIGELVKKHGGEQEVLSVLPPFSLSPEVIERVSHLAKATKAPFGTEAGYYKQAGIETLIIGPGDPSLAHSREEHIKIEEIGEYARLLENILEILREE